jgi:ferredoxin-NADP reductase
MARETEPAARGLLVRAARREADGVLGLELVDPAGAELTAWRPGAHLDLHLPSGLVRQYSLCGDPQDLRTYRVAVLREVAGRGGSAEVHDTPLVGRVLTVGGPRNHFELVEATCYVFIAGGIGITPILPMIAAVAERGVKWRLHYGGRSRASMAFVEALSQQTGGELDLIPNDEFGHPDLATILPDDLPDGLAVYCCGPAPMIAAVEARCAAIRRSRCLHVEHFGRDPSVPLPSDGVAFEVELAETGLTLTVPGNRSILDVVREVLPDQPYSCQEGACGTCETDVLDGIPEHRDLILTPEERAANHTMMICVGRSCSPRLVLKL